MIEDYNELHRQLNKAIRKYTEARDNNKLIDKIKWGKEIESLRQRIQYVGDYHMRELDARIKEKNDQKIGDMFSVFALSIYLLSDCLENSAMELNSEIKKLTRDEKRMKNYPPIQKAVEAAKSLRCMFDNESTEEDQDDITDFSQKLNIKVRAFAQKWLDRQKKRKQERNL